MSGKEKMIARKCLFQVDSNEIVSRHRDQAYTLPISRSSSPLRT